MKILIFLFWSILLAIETWEKEINTEISYSNMYYLPVSKPKGRKDENSKEKKESI